MSHTEAAASLFGSEDTTSDPFAALGTDFSQEASDNLFSRGTDENSTRSAAADLFESFGEQGALSREIADATQPAEQELGYTSGVYATYTSPAPVTSGTYGTQSEWNGNQTYYGTGATNNTYGTNTYVPLARHDPYAPPQTQAYIPSSNYQPPASQQSTLSHSGNQTSGYDTRNAPDPYAPPQPVNPQNSYAPYHPYAPTTTAATTYEPSYVAPQVPSYSSPPVPLPSKASLATVPAPPAPTTTQIARPKISNAYDPPFPTTSFSRRNVSGPAKLGQIHTTSAYSAYQSTTPPPLPPPPPRAPAVPLTYTPPPQPATQTPSHTSMYSPPPTQSQYVQPASEWNHEINATSESYASTTYPSSVPLPLPSSEFSAPLSDEVSESQWMPSQENGAQPIPEDVSIAAESGIDFFSQFDHQESASAPEELVPEPLPELQSLAPVALTTNIPKNDHPSPYSPDAFATPSPHKVVKIASPPPHRISQDFEHVSSPRHSPRPPSTTSPVYALSHPLRASPDLRKDSFSSEHIAGAQTTSPGPNGSADIPSPYAPPKGPATRTKTVSAASINRISSPEHSHSVTHDRYAPRGARVTNVYGIERTGSPNSISTRSSDGRQSTKPQLPPYLPPVSESSYVPVPLTQEPVTMAEAPYAPSHHSRTLKPSSSFGGYAQSPYSYNAELSPPQDAIIKPTIAPYAPSPSLVGANDPLGRTSVRIPVVTFGFGGKLVTCFHDAGMLNTGFDVALSSRTSTKVQVQDWKKLIPESALDTSAMFPGPLHADPGLPSSGIMKATASTQVKTKKTQLIKYLSNRAEEITQGLGYLHAGSIEKRTAEGKLVLVKLLRIMTENDGRLLGTPQLDSAVRTALVPRLEGLVSGSDSGTSFTTTADAAQFLSDSSYGSLASGGDTTQISVTTLRVASLDKIEEFLLRGERRQAYHYALDEKLWAHAMVIASSIDQEAWKEVVGEFIKSELGVKGESNFPLPRRADAQAPSTTNGREGLRVAYSLFSGQGAAAVQEMMPKNVLGRANGNLPIPAPTIPVPTLGQPTPRTPNFAIPAAGTKIPTESLSKWTETVAMIISSPLTSNASAALTALGDQLSANGWLEAAHVCYLLSPQTSPLGGVGNPTARITLLGSKSPAAMLTFSKDPDSIIFTEIMEYALATAPVPKGQEPNHGIPHLQAYRLLRAFAAAEAGDLGTAARYCEAITASLVRGSPYFTPTMLEQLKGLADRLSGVSQSDKPNSWMAGKISKPSLDTIGGWLEGRFTKLVTGESDSPSSPQEEPGKADTQSFAGPFAHYNTISSTTTSARSSPQPSFVTPAYALPPRTSSAMSNKVPYGYGIDRASSAMEPVRRKTSPGPVPSQAMSASAAVTSFPHIETRLNNYNGSNFLNGYSPDSDNQTPKASHDNAGDEASTQEVMWWGSSGYGDAGKTPTAAQFEKVDGENGGLDSGGFFSPMNNQSFIGPQTTSSSLRHEHTASYEDEDDDLGLGNNASKRKKESAPEGNGQEQHAATTSAKGEEKGAETLPAQQQSSGWFSRWWKRSDNTSGGPVRAKLGEESSFYYDQEQKRWVNKKAGTEAPKATPPPPPPRAQTASPAMSSPKPPGPSGSANGMANGNGAGVRSASVGAIDLTSPPTNKPTMRVRSSLAPPGLDSAPPTPTGTRLGPGGPPGAPPNRPRSQASQKKNIRSRYVDAFALEGGSGA